jgi:hypothetical protein
MVKLSMKCYRHDCRAGRHVFFGNRLCSKCYRKALRDWHIRSEAVEDNGYLILESVILGKVIWDKKASEALIAYSKHTQKSCLPYRKSKRNTPTHEQAKIDIRKCNTKLPDYVID